MAVWQDGLLLFADHFEQPRGRGGALFHSLKQAVENFGRADRIVVGTGPGSYNGIRAAISAAEGLRIAWGGSLVGIPSMLGLESPADRYAVVGDARGGSLFFSTVFREQLEDIQLLPRADFERCLQAWKDPVYATAWIPEFPDLVVFAPSAGKLAVLAAGRPASEEVPSPLYLKPPHITQPAIRSGEGGKNIDCVP